MKYIYIFTSNLVLIVCVFVSNICTTTFVQQLLPLSKMSAWREIGSCIIEGKLAVQNQENNVIVCEKSLIELLLLKELTEMIPGRYIIRGTYWGKKTTTIRFAKHNPCDPNCITEKIKVAGNTRVAVISKEEIKAVCDLQNLHNISFHFFYLFIGN